MQMKEGFTPDEAKSTLREEMKLLAQGARIKAAFDDFVKENLDGATLPSTWDSIISQSSSPRMIAG